MSTQTEVPTFIIADEQENAEQREAGYLKTIIIPALENQLEKAIGRLASLELGNTNPSDKDLTNFLVGNPHILAYALHKTGLTEKFIQQVEANQAKA